MVPELKVDERMRSMTRIHTFLIDVVWGDGGEDLGVWRLTVII
jgi:hypothetical protein